MRVNAPAASFAPLGRHIARRCSERNRHCIVAQAGRHEEALRVLSKQLGMAGEAAPDVLATELAQRCAGAVLVIAGPARGQWGSQVREALHERARRQDMLLVIELTEVTPASRMTAVLPRVGQQQPADTSGVLVDEGLQLGELDEADRQLWWSAAVEQPPASFGREPDISRLDAWWQRAQALPLDGVTALDGGVALDKAADKLRAMLAYAGLALSPKQALALGGETAIAALRNAGVADVDERGLFLLQEWAAQAPATLPKRQLRRLASVLGASEQADGRVLMRAAEIAADAADGDDAERWGSAALSATAGRVSRQDLWHRYTAVLARLNDEERLARLLRAAEQALGLGDGERAEELTRAALALDSQRFDVLFAHGRASQLRGDLTAAALSLTRAMALAQDDELRAQAAALMAHVRLVAGDDGQAESFAQQSIDTAQSERTRLDGRNVLGKLLLARDAWIEAEQHFATDAYDASLAGEHEAELRARLNRALAVLSLGRREQARELIERVLVAGEELGLPQAIAFALSNLATVAILQHRFADALALSERAIHVRTQLGIRHGLVQPITNLAELRIMLGLIDEAEASLRFGLKSCGSSLPASLYAYFAKAMARVHLARGDSTKAQRSLNTALSSAAITGDVSLPGQCHRIAVRIALEDGDVARARASLKRAQSCRQSGFGVAEIIVIEAEVCRAGGEPYAAIADRAFFTGEQTGNIEAMLQACVLLAQAALSNDDEEAARVHLDHALQIRQGVVDALPEPLRERYIQRAEMRTLNQLLAGETPHRREPPTTDSSKVPARGKRSRREAAPKPQLIGRSRAMVTLRRTLQRVAETDTTVLIHGETGSGKELVAEAIHAASERSSGPMVKVNCAALVETLLLSELFGHERGAFTGASTRRRGRFELADGGTLFLDEIGDISPRTQVALLRVLQDGTFERVGGCTQLQCDVRVIVATHRDLKALVAEGKFREDLYYRLCGMVVEVPALRERSEDIADLAESLLARAQQHSGITPKPLSREALALLRAHSWPGNVRELQNALRAAAVFSMGEELTAADFMNNVDSLKQPESSAPAPQHSPEIPASSSGELVYAEIRGGVRLADMKRRLERQCIAQALVETGGNITRAAELLGMKRPRLSQLVKKYELATVVEEAKS